jgi:hypothetical protein
MSAERELLKKILATRWLDHQLSCEVEELLAQPVQEEREVSGKIISTDDVCNWNLTVGGLKDYDHVYVNGVRYVEFQPEQEQEPVAWMCDLLGNVVTDKQDDNNSYTPLYKSPPKRKTLSGKESEALWAAEFKSAISYLVFDEICVAIGGE